MRLDTYAFGVITCLSRDINIYKNNTKSHIFHKDIIPSTFFLMLHV